MKRDKKNIEADLRNTLCRLKDLIKEYIDCQEAKDAWVAKTLDFTLDALEALSAFLERQRDKARGQGENDKKAHQKINVE